MIDASASIADFLSAAAAKQPTPGGGAVAALAGALAASMGEMVLAYSVAKKDLLPFSEQNRKALAEFTDARELLIKLMVDDQTAYQALSDAKKAGAATSETQAIARRCIAVPRMIGTAAINILKVANRIATTSNKWLLSDLAVCGELATATVRCAVHNIRVNLTEVEADDRAKYVINCEQMLKQAVELVNDLMKAINRVNGA